MKFRSLLLLGVVSQLALASTVEISAGLAQTSQARNAVKLGVSLVNDTSESAQVYGSLSTYLDTSETHEATDVIEASVGGLFNSASESYKYKLGVAATSVQSNNLNNRYDYNEGCYDCRYSPSARYALGFQLGARYEFDSATHLDLDCILTHSDEDVFASLSLGFVKSMSESC
ncbi:hypothetical protein MMH89_01725 [Candidatus Comchoanobacter bicostacola]|uniref:Outer membrane protein beta-barrel domain-containing protein n=1 Tax=Candidatus Comchoanobacter bicostacola TaxID=2919598 RepID=A0ABY5DKT8_9GAMM|nr:hypothetical protein [Candidatus Comchoanobacter bicostacola]UTC24869.1 hypothetical protein MMH89_01725 [Candidatus Comchoanobacter bicostacola]